MSVYRLDRLLAPHSLAVIGASPRETSVGRHIIANIRAAGFPGAVHVVNPNHAAIEGIATVKSLDAIAGPIDVAVIAVPPAAVPETVAAAGAKGAAAAIIITAGLGHGAGSLAEAADRAARATGLRLVGPNCIGVLVPPAHLNASFAPRMPIKGDLAVISQSGAIVAGMIEWAARRAIGFSAVFSVGDQLDVDFGDLLDLFAADGGTRAILLYVEFDQGRPQVHVGGAGGGAGEAGHRPQGGPPQPGRQGRRDPYRRARRIGCGLRRRIPPRRPVARARSRRAVRHHRDARAPQAVSRQPPRDPDQWRRRRRARRRPPDRSRRHACGDFAGNPRKARCGAAADLVEGQSRRHRRRRRRRALFGRARGAARRSRERRRAGARRADRARLADRDGGCRRIGHPRLPREDDPAQAGARGVGRRRRRRRCGVRRGGHSGLRDRSRRRARLHRARALRAGARGADGDAAEPARAVRARRRRGARAGRGCAPRRAALARSAGGRGRDGGLCDPDGADGARPRRRRGRRGGAAVPRGGNAGGRQDHVAGHRPQVGHRRRAAQSRLGGRGARRRDRDDRPRPCRDARRPHPGRDRPADDRAAQGPRAHRRHRRRSDLRAGHRLRRRRNRGRSARRQGAGAAAARPQDGERAHRAHADFAHPQGISRRARQPRSRMSP